jgi:uncharacterized Tic20 family protein
VAGGLCRKFTRQSSRRLASIHATGAGPAVNRQAVDVEEIRMSVPPESVIPPAPGDSSLAGMPSAEERQWAMFAHLSALAGLLVPFGSIIGPLVIWLIKKDTMAFVNDQGKEALNFNITVAIAAVVCWVLCFILIGILLFAALAIVWLVFVIIAAIKANEGTLYRYPFVLRLVK